MVLEPLSHGNTGHAICAPRRNIRMHEESLPVLRPDVFGEALERCVRHKCALNETFLVVERDDGFVTAVDMALYLQPPDPADTVETMVIERAAGRVLDVGCGGGRHAVAMAARGLAVVGADTSAAAVAVCRSQGVDARIGSALHPGDPGGGFDTIVLAGQNLGLLESRPVARRVLASLATVAAPGARILGTGTDPYTAKNPVHLAYMDRNAALGRLPGQERLRMRYDNGATGWFDYLYVSVDELTELLDGSPWELADVAFDARRMYYLAELRLA
jgi:SAM-dependent methyltransferase